MKIEIRGKDIKSPAEFIQIIATNENVRKLDVDVSAGNGTGYFNSLTSRELEPGLWGFEVGGRYGIIAATPVGNVVMFQRYAGGAQGVAVCNWPRNLLAVQHMLRMTSSISCDQMAAVLDDLGVYDGWLLDPVRTNVSEMVAAIQAPLTGEDNE